MKFKEVCKDIKSLKIQGAYNVAVAGIKAMKLKGFDSKKILALRPTEPALCNGLKFAKRFGINKALAHFEDSKARYTKYGVKKIPQKGIVFTHCHSSSVISVLKKAYDKGKRFSVYNTETRPKYQGRKTSRELLKYGIKVTEFVDSAAMEALKEAKIMIIGCDAVLKDGRIINKIGSGMFVEIAYDLKVPVYVVTDSWKFSNRSVKLEERNIKEVWKKAPNKLNIQNPIFEIISHPEHVRGIISELGVLSPKKFVKKVQKVYPWI